jgi:protein arginine N-methyltransferase 2
MRERGWYDRKGVVVLEGKWQDFVGTNLLEDMVFDMVYTDTFSEEYEGDEQVCTCLYLLTRVAPPDLRLFFDHLPKLLAGPSARFSFFNGLGATSNL